MPKTLKLPSAEEFGASLDETQKWAMSVEYDENDVNDIIKSVRKKKQDELSFEKYQNIDFVPTALLANAVFPVQ